VSQRPSRRTYLNHAIDRSIANRTGGRRSLLQHCTCSDIRAFHASCCIRRAAIDESTDLIKRTFEQFLFHLADKCDRFSSTSCRCMLLNASKFSFKSSWCGLVAISVSICARWSRCAHLSECYNLLRLRCLHSADMRRSILFMFRSLLYRLSAFVIRIHDSAF